MDTRKAAILEIPKLIFPYTVSSFTLEDIEKFQLLNFHKDNYLPIIFKSTSNDVSESNSDSDKKNFATLGRITSIEEDADAGYQVRVVGNIKVEIQDTNLENGVKFGEYSYASDADISNVERAHALSMRAKELFSTLVSDAFKEVDVDVQVVFPDDAVQLSYAISNFLPLKNDDKHYLFELEDSCERLAVLIPIIEEYLAEGMESGTYRVTTDQLQDWISPN